MRHAKTAPIHVIFQGLTGRKDQPNLFRSMAMATFDLTNPAARSAGRVSSPLTSAFKAFSAWNDARKTRNELSQLSPKELNDIGITRADIDRIAFGAKI